MTEQRFTDAATISGARKTQDGFLVAEAFAVRTGIQIYAGREVGLVDRDVVRVWRPEEEVRAPESLRTFSHAPLTIGHPGTVTADNWAEVAKGEVSTEAEWDGNKIKLPLIVKDAGAIEAIEGGQRELSAGYTCELEFTDGVTPEGEAYDAIQRNIRINHLAIVPRGRAGSECRIGDADTWGAAPIPVSDKKEDHMSDALKTVVLGDKAVQVAAADTATIDAFKASTAKALADAQAESAAAIAAKDREIATKDAEIEKLKGAALSDADIDNLVKDRADLMAKAKTVVADFDCTGKSPAEIRSGIVSAKLGDAAVADKTEAYIEARFDVLAEDAAKTDPMADALKGKSQTKVTSLDQAYADRNTALESAWMKKEA